MGQSIKSFCEQVNISEDQFFGRVKIKGSLNLSSLTSIPEGFNPTVGEWLDLESLTSIPDGFNPTVGEWLDLSSLTSIAEGFNPTVGGSLYLNSLTSIPERFNPTVGGSLDLRSLTSIPEGLNPTVGGWLDLRSLTSIPKGFNPTVGGLLYLNRKTKHINSNIPLISWQNGKYISVDGIFTEVLNKRGNVYKVKKLNDKKEFYIVTDGQGKFAHGDSIREAKEDLIYKISNRDLSEFEHLTENDILTFEEAIECYRVITGSCAAGVKDFVKNKLKDVKPSYSIKEIIELTENAYQGETFKNFFNK